MTHDQYVCPSVYLLYSVSRARRKVTLGYPVLGTVIKADWRMLWRRRSVRDRDRDRQTGRQRRTERERERERERGGGGGRTETETETGR